MASAASETGQGSEPVCARLPVPVSTKDSRPSMELTSPGSRLVAVTPTRRS